jgi:hypothetical protein
VGVTFYVEDRERICEVAVKIVGFDRFTWRSKKRKNFEGNGGRIK